MAKAAPESIAFCANSLPLKLGPFKAKKRSPFFKLAGIGLNRGMAEIDFVEFFRIHGANLSFKARALPIRQANNSKGYLDRRFIGQTGSGQKAQTDKKNPG